MMMIDDDAAYCTLSYSTAQHEYDTFVVHVLLRNVHAARMLLSSTLSVVWTNYLDTFFAVFHQLLSFYRLSHSALGNLCAFRPDLSCPQLVVRFVPRNCSTPRDFKV